MLPQLNRLRGEKKFKFIFRKGFGVNNQYFQIKNYRPKQEQQPQIGIVISTKVSKKSIERNKLKRRIREIIRELINKKKMHGQTIIQCKPAAKELKFEEIQANLTELIEKVNDKLYNSNYKTISKNPIPRPRF